MAEPTLKVRRGGNPGGAEVAEDGQTMVCPSDRKHGLNSTCYMTHRCRCEACGEGQRARDRRRPERARKYPVADEIRDALSYGWEESLVRQVYGIPQNYIEKIKARGAR